MSAKQIPHIHGWITDPRIHVLVGYLLIIGSTIAAGYFGYMTLVALIGAIVSVLVLYVLPIRIVDLFLGSIPVIIILPGTARLVLYYALFFALAADFAIRVWRHGFRIRMLPRIADLCLAGYIIVSLISAGFSRAPFASITEVVRYVMLYLSILFVYNSIESDGDLKRSVDSLLIGASLFCVCTIPTVVSLGPPNIMMLPFNRISPFDMNPNTVSVPLTFLIPFLFAAVIIGRELGASPSRRIFALLGLVYASYLLLLTNSRASTLCVGIASLMIILYKSWGKYVVLGVLIAGAAAFVVFYDMIEFMFRLGAGISGRDVLWDTARILFSENPWLGVGPGMFEAVKYKYIVPSDLYSFIALFIVKAGAAHNLLLTVAAELGVWGLACMVPLLVTIAAYGIWAVVRGRKGTVIHGYAYVALAIYTGLLARSIFECGIIIGSGWLNDNVYFIMLFVVISHAYAARRVSGKNIREPAVVT